MNPFDLALDLPVASGARILLMDDERLLLRVVAGVLRTAGYVVDVAEDGDAAVQLHEEAVSGGHPYDLLILDLAVPGGTGGQEALRRIRARDADVKALVSSAWSHHPVMTHHVEHGFDGRLVKPYGMSQLLETVGDTLAA